MRLKLSTYLRRMARLAMAVTIITTPFRYRFVILSRPQEPIYKDFTDILLFPADVFLMATLGLWLVSLVLERRRVSAGPFFLTVPIVGISVMGVSGTVVSIDPMLSFYHSIRLLLLTGWYLYVLNEIKSLSEIVAPVAVQVFIQSMVGVVQVMEQHSLGLQSLGELELDPAWHGVSIVWAEGIRSLRAYGLTDHPNILGGCLAFALALMAGWYVDNKSQWRMPVAGVHLLGALGLLLTFSRSAWLALAGGFAFGALLYFKKRLRYALQEGLALIASTLILLAPFAWQNAAYLGVRLNQQNSFQQVEDESRSFYERNLLNEVTNKIFADHALLGVGLGALPRAMRDAFPKLTVNYQPAHVVLLDVAAELGIFGALFYAVTLIGPWLALVINRRRIIFSPTLIGMSAVLLALTLIGFFDYYTWLLTPGRLWQWLIWGTWSALYQSSFTGVHDA